jgi:hypothetical protein
MTFVSAHELCVSSVSYTVSDMFCVCVCVCVIYTYIHTYIRLVFKPFKDKTNLLRSKFFLKNLRCVCLINFTKKL